MQNNKKKSEEAAQEIVINLSGPTLEDAQHSRMAREIKRELDRIKKLKK